MKQAVNLTPNPEGTTKKKTQVVNNPDPQNSHLAIAQLIKQAINQERRNELTLYRNYASDDDFQRAIENTIIQILENKDSIPDLEAS